MNAAALYGLIAWGILAGAAATFLPRGRRRSVGIAVAGVALTPLFAGESLAMGLHGLMAAPSASLFLLGLWRLAMPRRASLPRGAAAWILVAAGLSFYALALGVGPLDPYGPGYQPALLIAALGAWLAWQRHTAALVILGLDLLAYGAGLFANLWDALFDPVLVVLLVAGLLFSRRGRG